MKTYKITKIEHLCEVNFEAQDDKEFMFLYREGVIDEVLSTKNAHQYYKITDEDGNVVFEHTYT
jgi:predicted esterase YcpF (UPF0227 family)